MNEPELLASRLRSVSLPDCARLLHPRLLVGQRELGGSISGIAGWPFSASR